VSPLAAKRIVGKSRITITKPEKILSICIVVFATFRSKQKNELKSTILSAAKAGGIYSYRLL
ncbi:MAG: hypothetical protein WCA04_14940, partial [Geobacteraceae bacterium]